MYRPTFISLSLFVASGVAYAATLQRQASAQLADINGRNARAFVVSQASWASADQGRISIWWGRTSRSSGASTTFDTGAASNWSYTFVAAADGVFRADWLISTSGSNDVMGLNRLNTTDDWGVSGGGDLGGSLEDPSGSGISVVPLQAGLTYTMGVSNVGYAGDNQGFAFRVGNGEAQINWVIDYTPPVLQPGTWALMVGGLAGLAGLTGVGRRRPR